MQIEIKDKCVGDHMTELMSTHPDMSHEQMVAIALKKCGQSYQENSPDVDKAASWSVSGARDLPIVNRSSWDGPAAAERILNWAGFNGDKPDSAKARRGFLVYDSSAPELKGSYKLPFADIASGKLVAVDAGLRAAASYLPKSDIGGTQDRARAIIDAYEKRMNEKKDMGMEMDAADMLSQEETNYTTVSPKTGTEQCANCRWFQWANMMQAGDGKAKMGTSSCHLVECMPEPILPTGYCDRWEADPPENTEPDPIPVTIVDMEFTPAEPPVTARTIRKLTGKPLSGYTITKDGDGRRLMVLFTSNGYKDREFEHVATKALAEYVSSQWKGDEFQGDNVHLFWHNKALGPIGDIVWAGMIEGFLVEISRERNHAIAHKTWDFIESHPELDWGASHGFKVRQMADADTYSEIRKFESSSLPRAYAANPLTYSGVFKMVDVTKKDPKAALLDEIFHIEDVAGILASGGPKALNEALTTAGVEAKALKEEAAPAEEAVDFTALVRQLIEGQQLVMQTLSAIGAKVDGEATARAALETTVKAQLEAVKADSDKLKAQLALAPRSVSRDNGLLSAVPKNEAAAIKDSLPKEGSDFWLGAVPPEKH